MVAEKDESSTGRGASDQEVATLKPSRVSVGAAVLPPWRSATIPKLVASVPPSVCVKVDVGSVLGQCRINPKFHFIISCCPSIESVFNYN